MTYKIKLHAWSVGNFYGGYEKLSHDKKNYIEHVTLPIPMRLCFCQTFIKFAISRKKVIYYINLPSFEEIIIYTLKLSEFPLYFYYEKRKGNKGTEEKSGKIWINVA